LLAKGEAFWAIIAASTEKEVEAASIIVKESAEHLKLAEGKDAYAVIKASSVMIASANAKEDVKFVRSIMCVRMALPPK
jgi:molybdopterin-binding protein